jgi:AbrB family looped-hinge helix DNA binding protein
MVSITSRVGKRGTIVIPAELRQRLGLNDETLVVIEEQGGGVLIRPAVALPIDVYSQHRIAEFMLNNASSPSEYDKAVAEVRARGIDPSTVPHEKPRRVIQDDASAHP